jgi:F-type H+-transporting ATPase subunit alpha
MPDAEQAVRAAAANIPADVRAKFETAATLADDERLKIVEIARQALAPLQPATQEAGHE